MLHRLIMVSLIVVALADYQQLPSGNCDSKDQCENSQRDNRNDQNALLQTKVRTSSDEKEVQESAEDREEEYSSGLPEHLVGTQVSILNQLSKRKLYANHDDNWGVGIGAGFPPSAVGADDVWLITKHNGGYQLVNTVSHRKLYANHNNWADGVGAGSPPSAVGGDGVWLITKQSAGYQIVNKVSHRKLYASAGANWGAGFGAGSPPSDVGPDGVWLITEIQAHHGKTAGSGKRCSNYKVNDQWTRVWTRTASLSACATNCVEDARAASVACNFFAYKDGQCMYNPTAEGCKAENWVGWSLYQPVIGSSNLLPLQAPEQEWWARYSPATFQKQANRLIIGCKVSTWREDTSCPGKRCHETAGSGSCLRELEGGYQQCRVPDQLCYLTMVVRSRRRRRRFKAGWYNKEKGKKLREGLCGKVNGVPAALLQDPFEGNNMELYKQGRCSLLNVAVPPNTCREQETSDSMLTCLGKAAFAFAMPPVGDAFTVGSLLANDCSGCAPSEGCATAVATEVAKKIAFEMIPYAGDAYNLAMCVKDKLTESFGSCMGSTTMLRSASGSAVALKSLTKGAKVQLYTPSDIAKSHDGTVKVLPGKLHGGQMLGWSWKRADDTIHGKPAAKFVRFKTKGKRQIDVTPTHFLWVKTHSALVFAKDVTAGNSLPVADVSGKIDWDEITEVSDVTLPGRYDPVFISSEGAGDMVVTETGLLVPVYAGGQEFPGIGPHGQHAIFMNWLKSIGSLEADYPCLFEEQEDSGMRIIKLIEFFANNADQMKESGGHVTTSELSPEKFFTALKAMAPKSIALQTVLGGCPSLAKHLGLQDLKYVQFANFSRAARL